MKKKVFEAELRWKCHIFFKNLTKCYIWHPFYAN